LRKINDAIDRFCASHPYWGIPNLMRYVVIGTVVMYVLSILTRGASQFALALLPSAVLQGEVWRLVTFIFQPMDTSPIFLAISLYFYYWMGNILESYWGTPKFTVYYLSGILLTIISTFVVHFAGGFAFTYGVHYVNMAMFLAYAALNPNATVYIFFILPVRMKWLAWADVIYFAYGVLISLSQGNWGGAAAPIIALLNFVVFFYPYFSRKARQERYRTSKQSVRFRQTVKASQQPKAYNHKCEICGRTDSDHPELAFRYCSRCAGYHCYCEEHIFNHVHHTEE